MPTVQPPTPPYVGPAKFHGGGQTLNPLKRIVIHGTVSECKPGGARAIASYFRRLVTRPSSAHYVVDPAETVQVVGDHQIAYHAPPNGDSIGVEHCDPVAGPASRWDDVNHTAMLRRSARLVAALCLAYGLPIRYVGPVKLRLGVRGITGHVDVSKAWGQTSHTDPGDGFPWGRYIRLVKAEAAALKAAPAAPPVTPIPTLVPAAPSLPRMHLVTANIRNNPDLPRPQVRHDMAAVAELGGVICWQEVAEADDWDDLRATLPETDWVHLWTDDECPISVRSNLWHVVASGQVTLHGGKAGVSPHRVVTWAEVARKPSPAFVAVPSVVVMNTHWVSKPDDPTATEAAWRHTAWATAHAKQSALVAEFVAAGKTVVGGGDFNRSGAFPGFTPEHVWLFNGGLDHLWTCPADEGARVKLLSAGNLGTDVLYTDHPARVVRLELSPSPLTGKVHAR